MLNLNDFSGVLQVAVGVGLAYSLVQGVRSLVFSFLRDKIDNLLYYFSSGVAVSEIEQDLEEIIASLEAMDESDVPPETKAARIEAVDEIEEKLLSSKFFLRRWNMFFAPFSALTAVVAVALMAASSWTEILLGPIAMGLLLGALLSPVPLAILVMSFIAFWYYFQVRSIVVKKLADMKKVRQRRRMARRRILREDEV